MLYLLEYKNQEIKISVYDTTSNSYETLKNQGEDWQRCDEYFWKWFKTRLKDDNEELVFEILSDEELEIDSSITAKITYIKHNTQEETEEETSIQKNNKQNNNSAMASYFIKEVEGYKDN